MDAFEPVFQFPSTMSSLNNLRQVSRRDQNILDLTNDDYLAIGNFTMGDREG